MLVMSSEGPLGAYVNSGGYVHEIMTLYKTNGLSLEDHAYTEYSWFPGYKLNFCLALLLVMYAWCVSGSFEIMFFQMPLIVSPHYFSSLSSSLLYEFKLVNQVLVLVTGMVLIFEAFRLLLGIFAEWNFSMSYLSKRMIVK